MQRLASFEPARTPWRRIGRRTGRRAGLVSAPIASSASSQVGRTGLWQGRGRWPLVRPRPGGGRRRSFTTVCGRPPDLMIGRRHHLAELGAGDGAADRDVHVRREAALRLDGGEILDVVADERRRFWMNRSNKLRSGARPAPPAYSRRRSGRPVSVLSHPAVATGRLE